MRRDFLPAAILMYRCASLEQLDKEKDLDTFTYKSMLLYSGINFEFKTSHQCVHISKHVQCRHTCT